MPRTVSHDGEATPGASCVFKGCRAVFHAAAGPVGVVLCSPWGFEDLAMRKSWRLLAEAIAAAGFPCLRFDYPGTGNSLGGMDAVKDVGTWTRSINDAADFLRAYSGVKRFVFIGQSLGATLAAQAAASRSDVAALIMIAPVARGKAYVRELAATARLVAEKIGITPEPTPGLSVLGFSLSHAMVESLKALDLTCGAPPVVTELIVFDRADRKQGAEVSEHYKRHGIAARLETVAPYHLLVSDATTIQPLPAPAASIVAALRASVPVIQPAAPPRIPLLPATLRAETFREEPLCFGTHASMHGLLCQPSRPAGSNVVLFLNRGLNAQIGWRRVTVDHARALAEAGIASLRIDVAGLGESPDPHGRPEPLIYADALVDDVRAAVDALVARGFARVTLVGVCSGAYTALATAAVDPRITGVVVVNTQRLVWNPSERIDDVVRYGLRSVNDYIGDLKGRAALHKLIKSRKRVVPALWFMAKRRLAEARSWLAISVGIQLPGETMARRVADLFAALSKRGAHVSLVYSDRDPGLRELQSYYGVQGTRLCLPHVAVSIIPDADHNLTTTRACGWLIAHLIDFEGQASASEAPESAAGFAQDRGAHKARPAACLVF